jgi:ABC-type uncharacterized transport system substrate-binding protein
MTVLRRSVLTAAAAWPMAAVAFAADTAKVSRVGILSPAPPDQNVLGPDMTRAFAARGYVEGKNIDFLRASSQGDVSRLPGLVDKLVEQHVDVIVTGSYPAAKAAKERGGDTPIVVTQSGDPVKTGLAASLAHPKGNITGVSEIASELTAKRLAVLKEAVPSARAVAVLWNADDFGMTLRYQSAEAEAPRLGMLIVPLGVHAPNDFVTAFAEMTKKSPDAIMMVTDVLTNLNRQSVMDFAAEHRLPAIFEYDYLVHQGGLMAYGPNISEIFDRAAELADRILKGAKPADLPLELPTRFDLAINLKTAEGLGLKFPQSILVQATDILE